MHSHMTEYLGQHDVKLSKPTKVNTWIKHFCFQNNLQKSQNTTLSSYFTKPMKIK